MALKAFKTNDNEIVSSGDGKANEMLVNVSINNKLRNLIYMPNIKAMEESIF